MRSRVVIIGCGALGSAQAESLSRPALASPDVDRDFVEFSNLQRQTMFTESDATIDCQMIAAAITSEVNSEINVEAEIADVNHSN